MSSTPEPSDPRPALIRALRELVDELRRDASLSLIEAGYQSQTSEPYRQAMLAAKLEKRHADKLAAIVEGAALLDRVRVPPAPPEEKARRVIKLLTCKRCGGSIDTGLCGYECELDNTLPSDRQPADMEVRVYEFIGVEPFTVEEVAGDCVRVEPPAPQRPHGEEHDDEKNLARGDGSC